MIPSPILGDDESLKVALQFGALIGVSLGALLIASTLLLPSPIYSFGLAVLAFLFARLFAAKRTEKVSTGMGVSLGGLLIARTLLLPSPIFIFGLAVLAFLFAGLFAAKRTGKVSTGTLAGLWSGFFSNIIIWAALFIGLSTVYHADLVSAAQSSGLDLRTAGQYIIWGGLVFGAIFFLFFMMGIGSGLGALGGLIGKSMSPIAQQPYSLYPPASSPTQAFQDFAYQCSPPPLPQHVYHLRPLWRVFYAAIYPLINLIVGLSLALKLLDTSDSSVFFLFFICLIILAVSYNISYGIRMSMARLVTSPVGVTYYGVGFRIYTPWHQIASIGKVWKSWRGIPWMPITGFTFRTPPARVQSANQALQEQVPVIEISLWRRPFYRQYTRLIPLTWFVGNLQNSALGGDISWSAPHLLGGIPSASNSRGRAT